MEMGIMTAYWNSVLLLIREWCDGNEAGHGSWQARGWLTAREIVLRLSDKI
jgi:hypothetical protein